MGFIVCLLAELIHCMPPIKDEVLVVGLGSHFFFMLTRQSRKSTGMINNIDEAVFYVGAARSRSWSWSWSWWCTHCLTGTCFLRHSAPVPQVKMSAVKNINEYKSLLELVEKITFSCYTRMSKTLCVCVCVCDTEREPIPNMLVYSLT